MIYARLFLCLFCCLLFIPACKVKEEKKEVVPLQPAAFLRAHLPSYQRVQTIAIGSCNRQWEQQPMWEAIIGKQPDLWIWLGDNIYGDSENPAELEERYRQQLNRESYRTFMSKVPLIGTWDDHDYGQNDSGSENPIREQSQQLALDFLGVPDEHPVRRRQGIYQSYTYGPEGQQVKVILLDTRYFRDPLEKNPAREPRYFPNPTGDILGEEQWTWLEKELSESEADFYLICSGIQILPEDQIYEKWANFPSARQRMLNLIRSTSAERTLLLSGDRHISELSLMPKDSLGFDLYEFTSSGLTHSFENVGQEANRYRVGPLVAKKSFGLIHFDWNQHPPKVSVEAAGLMEPAFFKKNIN